MSLPPEGLVPLKKIIAPDGVMPISRSSFYALISAGKAPKPVRLSPRRVGWRVEEIRAWIADPTSYRAVPTSGRQ